MSRQQLQAEIGGWGAVETIGRGVQAAPALRTGFGVTFLLAMVGAGGRVVVPVLIQQAIDKGFSSEGVDVGYVGRLALIGFIAVVIATIAQRTAVSRLGRRSEEALYGLRVRLFSHIHRLSLEDHNDERRGALVARVTSDTETLAQFFQWGSVAWLLDGSLMLVVAAVMLAYNWLLAVIAFVVAAPLVFVLRRVQTRLVAAYDRARARNSEQLTAAGELVAGAETLRVYEAGERFGNTTKQVVKSRADANVKAGVIGAMLFPSGELFSVLTVITVIGVGVAQGPSSGLTAGALIGFVFLTYRFLEPIAEFTEILDMTQTAVAGLRRVLGVLEIPVGPPPPLLPTALPSGPLDLAIDNVSFSYRNRLSALDTSDEDDAPVLIDVHVSIPAGQQVAVVGETGSGKTTLGRLLARFADPTAGSVRVGGVPLTQVGNDDLRTRLVVVPQEPFLFDGTIADNLGFARPGSSLAELYAAVEDLDLGEWLDGLPEGLATMVGPRGAQLSAGERQLVALVRASLVDPAVLVLDEATSSVDALTEVRLAHALERLAEGRTTIAIAHRLSTAARADRVLVLDRGRLVEDGHHLDLIEDDGVYARMYDAWIQATTN